MQERIVKYFWILNLLTLAAVAYFAASGVSELVAAEFESSLPEQHAAEPMRPRTSSQADRPVFRSRNGTPILRRNIFDSKTGPIDPNASLMEEIAAAPVGEDALPLLECQDAGGVQARVLATVASEKNPEWSFVSMASGKETRLLRMGDEIDGRTVSGIGWRYVFLRGSRDECYIDLFGEQKKAKRRGRRDKTPSRGDIKDGIKVVSANERIVDRAVMDQALANPAKFARSVRVRPYKRKGEVVGFRIRRIKKNSPLSKLGAQKGDIFHSVNGVDLTSVDKALAAYQNMRDESQLVFDITRKGRKKQLKITVQ